MLKENEVSKFLERALRKMFAMVGRIYKAEICKQSDWYMEETWTKDRQKEFATWMETEYIKTFKSSIKEAKWETAMFILCYGWRTPKEE